jgi:hypothetical protein
VRYEPLPITMIRRNRLLDKFQPDIEALIMNNDLDFIVRVLNIFWKYDIHGDLHWNVRDGKVAFEANCSDLFWWGTADFEEITPENIHVLEQAFVDIRTACGKTDLPEQTPDGIRVVSKLDYYGPDLFAARIRGMRPQGAVYREDNKDIWPLFDACGPVRDAGLLNPKEHPEKR